MNAHENLFAYGTLMCADIMAEVSGIKPPPAASAILKDFRRVAVRGEHYPAIVPHPENSVTGVIYRNIPRWVWKRLDQFEGSMYLRKSIIANAVNGQEVTAQTYVIDPTYIDFLTDTDWDFSSFLRSGKQSFRGTYRGYQSVD